MASHSERASSLSLILPYELPPSSSTTSDMEPSLPDMEPSSSPPMAYSSPIMPPSSMSSEDHGALFNSAASLESLESLLGSGSTAEPSSSPPFMPSSPLLAPSSPIEPPSPVFHHPVSDFSSAETHGQETHEPQQRILILGATGNQGRGCLRALLASKHRDNYTIGVLVRDFESASAVALSRSLSIFSSCPSHSKSLEVPQTPSEPLSLAERLSSLNVHLLSGDYSSPQSLVSAFSTFKPTTIFFPPPLTSDFRLDLLHATNVISTAASSTPSLTKIIISTALGTDRRSSFPGWGRNGEWHPMSSYWNTKSRIESLVSEPGRFESWTILRPAWFLHSLTQRMVGWSYLGWKDSDKVRTIRTKWKRGTRVAWVDAEDVGVVAARIVDDEYQQEVHGEGGKKDRYKNRGVDLAVESITVGELAEKMGKVLGEEVRVRYADEPWTWHTEDEKEGQDYYDWEKGRTVSDMDPIAISQRWANEFDSSYGVEATRELGLLGRLMTVDEFLERNREFI